MATRTLTFTIHRDDLQVGTSTLAWPIVKIGRAKKSHIVLDDPDVSRMHAVIEVGDDGAVIIDLGAEAGTYVNDEKIAKTDLRVGDVVSIGPFRLVLTDMSTVLAPPPKTPPPKPPPPKPPKPAAPPPPPACARCDATLVEAPLAGGHAYRELPIRVLTCRACAVTYVDVRTLEQRLRRPVRLTRTAAERARKRGQGMCPLCRDSLDRVTLEWAGSWVMIEECTGCGLLALESGELAVLERLAALV